MTDVRNRQFLEAITARLADLQARLGPRWPEFRDLLTITLRGLAEAEAPGVINEGIDDLIELFVDTPAEDLVLEEVRQFLNVTWHQQTVLRTELEIAAAAGAGAEPVVEAVAASRRMLDALDPRQEGPTTVVPVLYATDRTPSAKGFYGSGRASLEFGVAGVSIPIDNRIGALPQPRWWHLEFQPDRRRHVVLLQAQKLGRQALFDELRQFLADDSQASVLLFVHGYATTFVDAIRRAAQLAYDLEYRGVPLVYSWPSRGSRLAYTADETNVHWAKPHLAELLQSFVDQPTPVPLDIIAHSMGARAVMDAVGALQLPPNRSSIRNLVLAAPDIDADTFREAAAKFADRARRFTLYASSADWALWASKRWHGYPRAGDSKNPVIIRPILDTIDASLVDTSLAGHAYYGDNRSIVSDLFALVHYGQAPPRFGMREHRAGAGEYWFFRP